MDASVATAAMLVLVAPMMTGPGGDMFALVYIAKTGELAVSMQAVFHRRPRTSTFSRAAASTRSQQECVFRHRTVGCGWLGDLVRTMRHHVSSAGA